MFVPINDDAPRYRMQWVTFALIAANIGVYAFIYPMTNAELVDLKFALASIPWKDDVGRAITASFIHTDIWALLGNVWFLFLFGSSVEGKLGHSWTAAIYLVSAILADFADHHLAPHGKFTIGAAGAVGGMVGAYWFLFSRAQIDFLYVLTFRVYGVIALPVRWAVAYLLAWDGVMWFLEKYVRIDSESSSLGHVAGIAAGMLCGLLLRRFVHVTLDGEDMYTRFMVWRLRRKAGAAYFAQKASAAPRTAETPIPAQPATPSWDDAGVPERIPLDPEPAPEVKASGGEAESKDEPEA